MSSPAIYETFDLATEEKNALKESEDFANLSQHPAWLKLKTFIEYKVEKAHETMAGNISGDPRTYMYLQIRWQQQRDMLLAINNYVGEMVATRNELIARATEEPDEYGN